ncbi:MAG: 4Fe-4S binding protein [Nitrospirota bacterium]
MLLEFKKKRSRLQAYTWYGLPLVIIGGWIYPKLGYFLLACMFGAIGIAFYKGRAWCDWMCPRGSFYDLFLQKISAQKTIPPLFRKKSFRIFVLATMLSVLGSQIYFAWPDIDGIGMAMVKLLTVTTIIGIILGALYQQRVWCHICPMGTLGNYIADGKKPLMIDNSCISCKTCSKACPMQLAPYRFKEKGMMGDNDCIKCSSCVAVCPKKALVFDGSIKKAA